jgi:hypothetical protein
MVNSDFINPIEKLLDLQWCIPLGTENIIAQKIYLYGQSTVDRGGGGGC